MYSEIITNDPVCRQIINRFIKEHPELNITIELINTKLHEQIGKAFLEIDSYSDYIEDWRSRKGFKTDKSNIPEKLLLIHSEISEAVEANRKDDDIGLQEELADTYIRLMDLTSSLKYNMNNIIRVKMALNECRPSKHGKKY